MHAIVKTGGKQYKVAAGDKIKVEKIDVEAGKDVTLDQVLMIVDGDKTKIGAPLVDGAAVVATVVEHGRSDKILIFKKKRRQNYRRLKGHRQHETTIEIKEIKAA